jgi:hypothetical protein
LLPPIEDIVLYTVVPPLLGNRRKKFLYSFSFLAGHPNQSPNPKFALRRSFMELGCPRLAGLGGDTLPFNQFDLRAASSYKIVE